jgi:hypothetical protein
LFRCCAGFFCVCRFNFRLCLAKQWIELRAASQSPATEHAKKLTFADRVAYQRRIEEVYWRHRIWPKERPDPKPSLDAVMSQAELEKKVEDYLRKSQFVADQREWPITASELQAEMDRMAQHTKQPEVLREIFAALGNDPVIIAECLARPILSERLKPATAERRKGTLASLEARAPVQVTIPWQRSARTTRFP